MKLLIGLIEAACFSILCVAQQSGSPAGPGPEIQKMTVYAGQWRYEGESAPGPSGPADRFNGSAVGKMILNGFFLEWRWKDQGTAGMQEGFEIVGYDPINRSFASRWFEDDGDSCTGSYLVEANKFAYTGKCASGGKQQLSRVTEIFAPDLMSFVQKEEVSADGKTWRPSYEARYSKIRPMPDKQVEGLNQK